jgi:hypothetical protein
MENEKKEKIEEIVQPSHFSEEEMNAMKQENETLKGLIRVRDARDAITKRLASEGAASPGLLFAYAVDSLQFDAEGKLENAEAVVQHLKRSFPEQFRSGSAPSIGGGAGTGNQPPALTRAALAKMSPAEISRLDWAAVKEAMQS